MIFFHKILPLFVMPIVVAIFLIVLGLYKNKKFYIYISIIQLYIFSTPIFSYKFLRLVEENQRRKSIVDIEHANAIVVLSGMLSIHEVDNKEYIVKKGDSLYTISLLYDVNYLSIAKWNNIEKPYRIKPGQRISIKSKKFRQKKLANKKNKVSSKLSWVRPHDGKISKEFSYSDIGKKGIDISGDIGDEIYSVSDGVVVYTGDGIKGYGNLIIIKHNNTFLSAYAHTNRILVKENSSVDKGQVIAELGDSDSIKPILHFQIRKNGKSVDPENYLP